jgi:serpin B
MAKTLHYGELDGEKLAADYGPVLARLNEPRKDHDGTRAYDLVVANALWGQKGYPFKPEFLALNKKCYAAGLEGLDFAQSEAARKTINDWVAQQTREKIKDLIPPGVLTNLTRLVLTNAVYFKSNWADKFHKAFTKDAPFRSPGAQPANVPMMLRQGHYGYLEAADFQALELPYRCYDLSMVVLLPRKDDGLPALEQSLTPESLAAIVGKLASEQVRVTFPKFKIECGFSLPKALQALGMTDAFVWKKADFTGMTTAEDLFISDVIHKSYVAVDEEGTEAAAATAVVMRAGSAARREEPKIFTADHPFLFLIRHRPTGLVLFLGRVVEPK